MILRVGTLEIDQVSGCARIDEREVPLRPLDLRVLAELARRPGHVLTRPALSEALWGADSDVDERSIDACVTRLRKALDHDGAAIVTVRRVGYRLDPEHLRITA